MKKITSPNGIDRLVEHYHKHLIEVAGLAPATCGYQVRFARDFLKTQLGRWPKGVKLSKLTTPILLGYLLRHRKRLQPVSLQQMCSSLRSFFRFLAFAGHCSAGEVPVIPTVKTSGRHRFPAYLTISELQRVLRVSALDTPLGLRNQAILLCLARLGLRAGEVARLELPDIDWREGTLRLRCPKGRRDRLLPLQQELGAAIAAYLQRGRSLTRLRQVFVQGGGEKPLNTPCISALTRYALQKAGVSKRRCFGPHLLRHTFASHLAQRGVSLKAIADLLGHRELEATRTYAQVNLPLLAEVVQPWPQEGA